MPSPTVTASRPRGDSANSERPRLGRSRCAGALGASDGCSHHLATLSDSLSSHQDRVLRLALVFHDDERKGGSSVRQPGPGQGKHGLASTFGSLHGMSRMEADEFLRALGAEVRSTAGGYTRYKFPDSSEVWIRPNGEVVRLPQREYNQQGQRTNKGVRLDTNGALTSTHTTGEKVEN